MFVPLLFSHFTFLVSGVLGFHRHTAGGRCQVLLRAHQEAGAMGLAGARARPDQFHLRCEMDWGNHPKMTCKICKNCKPPWIWKSVAPKNSIRSCVCPEKSAPERYELSSPLTCLFLKKTHCLLLMRSWRYQIVINRGFDHQRDDGYQKRLETETTTSFHLSVFFTFWLLSFFDQISVSTWFINLWLFFSNLSGLLTTNGSLISRLEETRLMKQQLLSGRDLGSAQSCLLKEAPGMPY